jgi:hypothetical protein
VPRRRRRRRRRPEQQRHLRVHRPRHQLLDQQLDERDDDRASGQHDDLAEHELLDLDLDAVDQHDRLDRDHVDLRQQHEHHHHDQPELVVDLDDPELEQLLDHAEHDLSELDRLQQLQQQHVDESRHVDQQLRHEHPRCPQRPELMPR